MSDKKRVLILCTLNSARSQIAECLLRSTRETVSMSKAPCPAFFGEAQKLHHRFENPAALAGSEEDRLTAFRRVRDQLRAYLRDFNQKSL